MTTHEKGSVGTLRNPNGDRSRNPIYIEDKTLPHTAQAHFDVDIGFEPVADESDKRGRRTLVLADDLRAWIERLPAIEVRPTERTQHARGQARDDR